MTSTDLMASPGYGTNNPETIESILIKKEDHGNIKTRVCCWHGHRVKKGCLFVGTSLALLFTATVWVNVYSTPRLFNSTDAGTDNFARAVIYLFRTAWSGTLSLVSLAALGGTIGACCYAFKSESTTDDETQLIPSRV